ncbi:DUF6033 family protein [Paenibacillus thiaminolyticus]|uniref:DUF6033 family protein n=1 Tax=Paenibacillus thiaminolyticus TaxID=49283 RepID=UPI0035A6F059
MSITIANNIEHLAAAMNIRHLKQSKVVSEGSNPVDFKQLLSKADLEGVKDRISKKYGLSVGLESIPKNQQEIIRRGTSGGLMDVMIAPGIAEKMNSDPALRTKVEGYIDYFSNVERPGFERTDKMYGITTVASSLIIHEDGTRTVWSASVTSAEEVEKGKKIEAEKQKEKQEEQARLESLRTQKDRLSAMSQPSQLVVPQSNLKEVPYAGLTSGQEWGQKRSPIRSKTNSIYEVL